MNRDRMAVIISISYLAMILLTTVGAMAQGTVRREFIGVSALDAVQNEKIDSVDQRVTRLDSRTDALSLSVSDLAGSINRGTGIVVGIGLTLTLLQIVQMVLSRRK